MRDPIAPRALILWVAALSLHCGGDDLLAISETTLRSSMQPDFVAEAGHPSSPFWWLAASDQIAITWSTFATTLQNSEGQRGTLDLCASEGSWRVGDEAANFAETDFGVQLIESPGPTFGRANPPVPVGRRSGCPGSASVETFSPTTDATLELRGIVLGAAQLGDPTLDVAVVPTGAPRAVEPRVLAFQPKDDCAELNPEDWCTNQEWTLQMSLSRINWSPNLRVRHVRIYRGKQERGAPPGTEGRVLDRTFPTMTSVPFHSVDAGPGTTRCYLDPDQPVGRIDFMNCCLDRDCESRGQSLVTPGYTDANIASGALWRVDFRTSTGTTAPNVFLDADGNRLPEPDSLAIEFSVEPR